MKGRSRFGAARGFQLSIVKTAALFDRRSDEVSFSEIERVGI